MSIVDLVNEDLHSSGLKLSEIKELVEKVTPKELSPHIPKGLSATNTEGGLRFKYFDFEGQEVEYSRYKVYWKPLTGFAAHAKDTRPKYLQPHDTPNHLYIPPLSDWDEVLADPGFTVAITEGEKKAIAMNLRNVPTVGLGGVYSTGARKKGQTIIPELRKICEGGRNILIIFDIDKGFTTMKPEVAKAAMTLANMVLECGGIPKIVTLPSDGKEKCAVDDWLKTHELEGLGLYLELSQHAKVFDTAAALYNEAAKYIYIKDSNSLGNIKTREAVLVADYRVSSGNLRIATQELVVKKVKGGPPIAGSELVVRTLAEAFLQWHSRPTANSTTYEPGETHYLTERGEFNQWKGWAQEPEERVTEADVKPLWDAFRALYREDAEMMWKWFMYPIAVPGAKWVIIPVIQSEREGVGKSSIPAFFAKFVYGEGHGTPNNAATLNAMSLRDGRLEFMVRKQFLFLDDANDIHGNDVEALIKNLSTTDSVTANPKYLRSYQCKNIVNLCITTNRTMPFKVPEGDRRLFFPHVSSDVLPKVWDDLHKWGRAGGGAKVIAYAQQLFDVGSVNPKMNAPVTDKKEEIIGIARAPFENFMYELRLQAEAGELSRVIFTARELKAMAELEGEVRSAHDVGPATINRAAKLGGAMQWGGKKRVKIGKTLETIYVFADFEYWNKSQPVELAREVQAKPLDRIRLATPLEAARARKTNKKF